MTDAPEEYEKSRPPWRPSSWPSELGFGVMRTARYPAAIWALLREPPVKRLLARLALDEAEKAAVLERYQDAGNTDSDNQE